MNNLDIIKAVGPTMLLPILTLLGIILLFLLVKRYLYRRRLNTLARAGIGHIDKMDGRTFEQYLEAIYRREGYKTERTPYRGDFGGDLVIAKNGIRKVVQAKRWKRKVGVKAVQEAVAAKGYYGCNAAIVVSNSHFTSQAMELARKNAVKLVGRRQLLDEFVALAELAGAGEVNLSSAKDPHCSMCGKAMTRKEVDYCLRFTDRFKGAMLCYGCQRHRPRPQPS
jgi:restriction system protein